MGLFHLTRSVWQKLKDLNDGFISDGPELCGLLVDNCDFFMSNLD